MSIMMINKDNCNNCIHKKVCQYQLEKEEAINQIGTRVANVSVSTENNFIVTFNCLNYYKDEKTRTTTPNTINNPYW